VRSHRGTQFRQWATARLTEYLVKGFTMDDERLKNPPGKGHVDYFDELLARIRDIRSSERRFYQKVLDIYATSVDYTPDAEASQRFFAAVQNKMHWAAHGHTAAEIVAMRADATRPNMGSRPGLAKCRAGRTSRSRRTTWASFTCLSQNCEVQLSAPMPKAPGDLAADVRELSAGPHN